MSHEKSISIGFIGAGNMAQAIGLSLLSSGFITPDRMYISAPSKRNFRKWEDLGVKTTHDNGELVLKSDVVILAMKPQFLDESLEDINITVDQWTWSKLVISIIAGLSLETLNNKLKHKLHEYRLIKAMPNTSSMVGAGCTGITPDKSATQEDIDLANEIFSCGGICEIIPESAMNVMGALTGSGVAFAYTIMEALSDGAVKQGMPRALSYKLSAQMLLGAAKMVLETGEHPAVLKDGVCSPGGTTICGIYALERGGLRSSLIEAIEACTTRSAELDKRNKK